eukprot:gene2746-3380_t
MFGGDRCANLRDDSMGDVGGIPKRRKTGICLPPPRISSSAQCPHGIPFRVGKSDGADAPAEAADSVAEAASPVPSAAELPVISSPSLCGWYSKLTHECVNLQSIICKDFLCIITCIWLDILITFTMLPKLFLSEECTQCEQACLPNRTLEGAVVPNDL